MSNDIETSLSDLPLWSDEEAHKILLEICEKYQIPIDVVTELVTLQRERQHQERAAGIYARFEEILGRIE
jgi:hypothetical protein